MVRILFHPLDPCHLPLEEEFTFPASRNAPQVISEAQLIESEAWASRDLCGPRRLPLRWVSKAWWQALSDQPVRLIHPSKASKAKKKKLKMKNQTKQTLIENNKYNPKRSQFKLIT